MAPPTTSWSEIIRSGEEAELIALAERLAALQRGRARGRAPDRGLHAKGNAVALAELETLPDLPPHASVGIFASPAKYRAYVRYSNGSGARAKDAKPDVRGLAVKIVGVPGKKLIAGLEDAVTQDFLMIRTPSVPFRDAETFVWFVEAAESPALLPFKVIGRFGLGAGIRLLKTLLAGLKAPMASVAATRYYTALPLRWGAHAAKCSLVPSARDGEPLRMAGPDAIGEDLRRRLKTDPVRYDLQAQFFVDEASTPIEDPTRPWDDAVAPWVTIARLTLPRQDAASASGRALTEWIEKLSFDPWHAPQEFRPLGQMMRARNHAYRVSVQARGASPEPDGSERFE